MCTLTAAQGCGVTESQKGWKAPEPPPSSNPGHGQVHLSLDQVALSPTKPLGEGEEFGVYPTHMFQDSSWLPDSTEKTSP